MVLDSRDEPKRAQERFEAPWRRWGRRLVTIPAAVGLAVVAIAGLPLWLLAAAALDVARRSPWVLVRCVLFFAWYLVCEVGGLAVAFVWPLLPSRSPAPRSIEVLDRSFRLQGRWAEALWRGGARIFGISIDVEGIELASRGPVILFARHASTVDTVLVAALVSRPYGILFRYVLKRELLWDPCLDVVGNRLPNVFVDRSGRAGEREIEAVRGLLRDLGPKNGVLIYPEGTRFTPERKRRIVERLEAAGDAEAADRARTLRHVLPPRRGGPVALLESNPGADVLVFAHTGLEGARSFRELLQGPLVGATVRGKFWRHGFVTLPREGEALGRWLEDRWREVDDWIDESSGRPAPRPLPEDG